MPVVKLTAADSDVRSQAMDQEARAGVSSALFAVSSPENGRAVRGNGIMSALSLAPLAGRGLG
jgi:hypothetical protein